MDNNARIEAFLRLAALAGDEKDERLSDHVRIPLKPSQKEHIEEIAAYFNLPLATVAREALILGMDTLYQTAQEGEKNAKRRAK